MGLLTYDPPTLGVIGSQPATDIVDALDEIKAEANGSVETANLADGAADNIDPITRQRYAETARYLPVGPAQPITTIPAVDGLLSVDLRFTATVASSGTGSVTAYLHSSSSLIILAGTIPTSTTPTTIFTCPGVTGVSTGIGAPVVFPGDSKVFTLRMYALSSAVNITNLAMTVDHYKDF